MLELITTTAFLVSTFYGSPVEAGALPGPTNPDRNQVAIEEPLNSRLSQSRFLEQYVRDYYRDTPILAQIAFCESSFRHFGKSGEPLKGSYNKYDVGVMQINTLYHGEKAEELGLDLETLAGNLAYAKYLYDKEGSTPWMSSSKCWQKSDKLAMK